MTRAHLIESLREIADDSGLDPLTLAEVLFDLSTAYATEAEAEDTPQDDA